MSKGHSSNKGRPPQYDFLPPEPAARKRIRFEAPTDVTDAEFVVIDKNVAQMRFNDNQPAARAGRTQHWLFASARLIVRMIKITEKGLRLLSTRAFAALVALMVLSAFWFSGGFSFLAPDQVVAMPARPALAIADISSRIEQANGMNSLLVSARVENNSQKPLAVPTIRLELTSGDTLIRTADIQPPQNLLQAGQKADFVVRLSHPGGKPPQIRLSFVAAGGIAG